MSLENYELTEYEKKLFNDNPPSLIKTGYLRIKTKAATRIPLVLNKIQRKIEEAISIQRKKKQPVRIAVLKFRQGGCSTYIQALQYAYVSQKANYNALTEAADDDGSTHLFSISKLYHEEMEKEHPRLTPQLKYSNEKKLEFHNKHSLILVDSAQNPRAGRSYTFQFVHLSEAAHFPKFKETMLAISQAVPEIPESFMFVETTANGEDNDFCLWWNEISKMYEQGDTTWIPLFLSWKDHDEYQRPFKTPAEHDHFLKTITGDERLIQSKHKLTDEQMNWRRRTIIDKCGGSVKQFQQEYPLSAEEAFLTTSRRVFGPEHTDPQLKNLEDNPYRGELEWANNRPVFVASKEGDLRVYETPKKGHRYVLAIDAAEGISGGDNAAIQIIDRSTWSQAAVFHANCPPDVLGRKAFNLGIWYNCAVAAPEVNGPGLVTTLALRDLGYPNIVHRQSLAIDQGAVKETDELGWNTNSKTKPLIISELESSLREILIVIKDKATLDEIKHYIKRDDGSLGSAPGWHDDLLMALAIGIHFAKQLPETLSSQTLDTAIHSNRSTGY